MNYLILIIIVWGQIVFFNNSDNYSWEGIYTSKFGKLIIDDERKNNFHYSLEVAFPSGIGDISGTAIKTSKTIAIHKVNCEYGDQKNGEIKLIKQSNIITIEESGCAFRSHGAGATFNGKFLKE